MLSGDISETDETYKIAFTYIRNIEFVGSDLATFNFINEEEPHRHFTLKILG